MRKVEVALEYGARYLYALAGGVALFMVGPLSARHRRMITDIAGHFGYRRPGAPAPALPLVRLDEVVPRAQEFELREPEWHDGGVSLYELVTIAKLVRLQRPRTAFEIGTFNGRTAANIAANAAEDATVYTLDLPSAAVESTALPLEPHERKFVRKESSGSVLAAHPDLAVHQLYGDSATLDYDPYRNGVDLVFVDGSHTYEYAHNDSLRAMEMLRDGKGLILWHDYGGGWPGVTRALNELYREGGVWSGLRWIRGTSIAFLHLR